MTFLNARLREPIPFRKDKLSWNEFRLENFAEKEKSARIKSRLFFSLPLKSSTEISIATLVVLDFFLTPSLTSKGSSAATFEKEIPCNCFVPHICTRYHGLSPVGAIPVRIEPRFPLPITPHNAPQTVRYARNEPPVRRVRRHGLFTKHPSLKKQSPMVWRIVGTYDSKLAYNKFTVFALTSSLFVPDAAKLFRQTRKEERWDRKKQRLQSRPERELVRAVCEHRKSEKCLQRLFRIFLDKWRLPNKNIFQLPNWTNGMTRGRWIYERPKGARIETLESNFPNASYLTYLVSKLGYSGNAAVAALVRAHTPWTRPTKDRRKISCRNADEQSEQGFPTDEVGTVSPEHPYRPSAPSRRTKVGGGYTKEQVQKGLRRMRPKNPKMKPALFEIVYRGRSTLQISNETNIPVEILYVCASRLREHIQAQQVQQAQ
jgi:hypothetical protein